MALHHRHKHRILTTIVTLIAVVLSINVFFLVGGQNLESALLITFGAGIFFLTLYHLYAYEHCHERLTMINNLTQIYFGAILLLSIVFIFLLRWLFNVAIIDSYLIMSGIVLVTVFLTLGSYDRFLEDHVGKRFPVKAPSPRKK